MPGVGGLAGTATSGQFNVIFKVLPLLLPLFGILRKRVYTYQWASMLILLYFGEGLLRALTDKGLAAQLAWVETTLALIFFLSCIFYVRFAVRARRGKTG